MSVHSILRGVLCVLLVLGACVASAQEKKEEAKAAAPTAAEKKEAEKKDAPVVPAADKKADPNDAPAAAPVAAAPVGPAAEFNAKLDEWKNILKELRTIKQKHLTAEGPDAEKLVQQWADGVARGDALIPQLRTLGVKSYAANKEDRNTERFLVQLLEDDMEHDRYEEAAALGKALLDSGCETKKVLEHAGIAAFCVNDYASAEKYLREAQNQGALTSELGNNFLHLVPEYTKYWEAEQELRKKEAAATGKDELPRIKISTTQGDIVAELFENEAPGAVGNFISLVEKKFYDDKAFHRVLKAFMAQGGCPKGDGTGGPGYNIYCECDPVKYPNHRKHFRGTLSMAHAGPDTGGSQFFLTFVPTAHLNGRHTAFGRVLEGMDVLGRITRIDPQGSGDKPEPDKIVKIEVLRKRDHEYKPSKVQ